MQGLRRRWSLSSWAQGREGPEQRALPLVDRILAARGLTGSETVDRFRHPKLTHLHDPGLLPQVDAAAERLLDALRRGERIVIYGDYDVDGLTATAILQHVMRAIAPDANLDTYIPHRLEEGYGLNADALRQLRADGADVVVSVDCGVGAVEPAAVARSIGLDLIITDHHHLPDDPDDLPDAFAIVHPRLPGSDYPFGELCGAGVAFKLAWRLATAWSGSERVGKTLQQTLLDMLPLAALGTIADVVPLVEENRVIASHGLRMLPNTPIAGLQALIDAAKLAGEKIDSEKVGFILGPRLNACGRMGHAAEALRLLTDAAGDEASRIAEHLTAQNRRRQDTERKIAADAAERAEEAGMTGPDRRIIVLANEGWHPGVVGIVCSRLVERFGRPAIIMDRGDDVCRGSARSIDGFSILDALHACREHLETFGGHEAAAGLALRPDRLDAFTEAVTEHANRNITAEQLTAVLPIDCDARLVEMDHAAVTRLLELSPFGRSNRRPTVRVSDVTVTEPPRQIGGQGKHLSMRLRQGDGAGLRAVWWQAGDLAETIHAGQRLDVAVEPKLNEWNGRVSVEVEMRDAIVR